MIQFFLMLFGLAFSNNNANAVTTNDSNQTPDIVQVQSGPADPGGSAEDTSGETTQLPPKK